MASVGLAAYSIIVRSIENKTKHSTLGAIDNGDLFTLLCAHLGNLKSEAQVREADKRTLRVRRLDADTTGRTLEGIIDSGEFGFESDIRDTSNGKITYHRRITDAEELPFYFLFWIPKGGQRGFVLLQTSQQRGVKSVLIDPYYPLFATAQPGWRLDVDRVAPASLWNSILDEGAVKKIRFIAHQLPDDVADSLRGAGAQEVQGEFEVAIKAHYKGALEIMGKVRRAIGKGESLRGLITWKGQEFDEVKVEVKFGSHSRTISLGSEDVGRAAYDLSDVKRDSTGHPEFDAISANARDILKELREASDLP